MYIHMIAEGLHGLQVTAGLFCDMSKAFDCVAHNILLDEIRHYKFSFSNLFENKSTIFENINFYLRKHKI